jgi:hypothetical protein
MINLEINRCKTFRDVPQARNYCIQDRQDGSELDILDESAVPSDYTRDRARAAQPRVGLQE